MKIEILIPYLIRQVVDVTVTECPMGIKCYESDEIEFMLFGRTHVLTFTIEERPDSKTLYYTIDRNYDDQKALRENEFTYNLVKEVTV